MAEYHALERRTRETAKRLRTERLVKEAVSEAVESAQPVESTPFRPRKAKKRSQNGRAQPSQADEAHIVTAQYCRELRAAS
jgi:hypothetical protein